MIRSIRPVRPAGTLMYEDDRDWVEDADLDHKFDISDEQSSSFGPGMGESSKGPRNRASVTAGKRMPIVRQEVVRLILQGLRDIGYNQSADVLEAESGYVLSTSAASDFQAAILGGRWSEALALLPELGISSAPSNSEEPASSSSSIRSGKARAAPGTVAEQVRFEIQVQKYLEFLEVGQKTKALAVLRAELAPVSKDPELLHDLSGHMMSMDKEDLYERASWDGASGTSRRRLLESVQKYISPQIMVPSRRLATLLDHARQHQIASCPYHQESEPTSLYLDHECKSGHFPSLTTHILGDHTDEVWRIEWSPDGMMLASAGKDKQVVIWQLKAMPKSSGVPQYSVSPLHHLRDHRDPVDAMAWSPDGETLVTAAHRNLYIWSVRTGMQRPSSLGPSQHNDDISSIQWKPDGSEFLVASLDCKIIFYSPTGSIVRQWAFNTLQIKDFAITSDSNHIVAVTTSLKRVTIESKLKPSMSARHIDLPDSETGAGGGGVGVGAGTGAFAYEAMENVLMVIRLADREIVHWTQDLRCELTSVKLSSDGKKALISCNPDEVQLWSIEPHLRFVRKFYGHMQSRFLIRSCFGAVKDRFVLSGSEGGLADYRIDGHIYVYQSNASAPIEVLEGHRSVVNAVAWNPVASRRIFASCSDDGEVRIWQPPLASEEGPEIKMEDEEDEVDEGMAL
ncbi:WD40-repeat-containing domain protein [Naematelia encephala]|uniref:WD40-repeat-containing domain protein n=1 Tax=Naematelia encephala TaxID=71784 RepID=A0A1Y2APF7_9TREE|nr:WD40-repeat-containing domain protein [Naematelia encephala]